MSRLGPATILRMVPGRTPRMTHEVLDQVSNPQIILDGRAAAIR
jgi:hypothetical protein